jgi:hypothetical protein
MVRWIGYTSQNIPGNQSFDLGFYMSLSEAKDAYANFCEAVYSDDCTMTLYYTHKAHEGRMVEMAKEFAGYGCPFDYPDRVIERGPRGGVKISTT